MSVISNLFLGILPISNGIGVTFEFSVNIMQMSEVTGRRVPIALLVRKSWMTYMLPSKIDALRFEHASAVTNAWIWKSYTGETTVSVMWRLVYIAVYNVSVYNFNTSISRRIMFIPIKSWLLSKESQDRVTRILIFQADLDRSRERNVLNIFLQMIR